MENLGIDIKLLIAQVVNFVLFLIIFKKFLVKPFARYIDLEKQKEIDREKALSDAVSEKQKVEQKTAKLQQEVKKEELKIIDEAKVTAEKLKERLVEKANAEIEDMRAKAKKQLEDERSEMDRKLQQKVLELSLFIVSNAMKDVLTEDSKKKITERLIKSSSIKSLNHEN